MHELSIAIRLIELAEAALEEQVAPAIAPAHERIVALRVAIGALSGVSSAALAAAFPLAAIGTACAGARLEIREVPACIYCEDCAAATPPREPWSMTCPRCGRGAAELIAGREQELEAIEVEPT